MEYYRIDVTVAGSQAIFDIDGGGTLDDSIIELVNSGGTVLATNDTGTGDVSFPGHDDAYLTYTFATAGTYYIRVGRFISNSVAQPMLAGQTYQLNISLQNAAVVTTTVTANNTSSLVADGGEGNDVLVGTLGNDTLIGGNGNDTASFVNAFNSASNGSSTVGVTVDLNLQQGAAQNTVAAGNDTLIGFENLIGSALNDTLTGDANDNIIEGGLGNDTLVGGNGNDTASYAGATAGVTVSLALQGAGQNTVSAGTDTLSGFENLLGSGFNDSLTGDANANILTGGAGDDTLNPGANAGGTIDLLDGGIGSDTASFAGVASGVTATLNGALDGTATIAGGTIATLRSIENLVGSSNADTLTGDANDNVIEGGLGDDVLDGGLGNRHGALHRFDRGDAQPGDADGPGHRLGQRHHLRISRMSAPGPAPTTSPAMAMTTSFSTAGATIPITARAGSTRSTIPRPPRPSRSTSPPSRPRIPAPPGAPTRSPT